jgi:hypothetical protein
MRWRWGKGEDNLEQAIASETPREHADAMILYARRKADKNKRRSRAAITGLQLPYPTKGNWLSASHSR